MNPHKWKGPKRFFGVVMIAPRPPFRRGEFVRLMQSRLGGGG